MEALSTIAFILGVVAYSVAGTLFFVELARREGLAIAGQWAPRAHGLGSVCHGAHLVLTSFITDTCPVASLPFALSLSALVLSAAYLLIARRKGLGTLGVVVAPLCLTFLIGAQFVGTANAVSQGVPRTLLTLHIAASLTGFALFLLAGAAGAFYLVQERRLKSKSRALSLGRLPALASLDLAEHRLLLVGFPLLTFGVVSGVVFMSGAASMSMPSLFRAGLAWVTWALVGAVLVMRALAGWQGRRTAYGTLAGVLCLVVLVVAYVIRAAGVGAA